MKIFTFLILLMFCSISIAQKVNYSPLYFGPNANPVSQFSDARIPTNTTIELARENYFGFGDHTRNFKFSVEVPLFSERVSLKVWTAMLEQWQVTQEIYDFRQMQGSELSGTANGDIYVQTRILILTENTVRPSIVLNSTLKTASGTQYLQRRYFDTPGYYFDVEIGKSVHSGSRFLNEARVVANAGFLCWETTNSTQNDAIMYGGKIILSNRLFDFENTLAGYHGWMNNGDSPLVYFSRLTFKQANFNLFAQFQYGINDFPYYGVHIGISRAFPKLTPK